MSYKSLYRKYRPNTFLSLSGQEHIIKILTNSLKNNEISHAYLFCGTRGTGKTTTAKIYARMVNCLNPKDNMPCGECEICKNENTDEISDIIEIDAASNNGVDEIRDLKSKIKLVPSFCKYKVYIIDEVHMLSTGAFNALLKTLEEPPEHVIFILATTEPQKLPVTIISRCQRLDFKKISNSEIIQRLKYISKYENIEIEDDALIQIAQLSDGALRDAIVLLEQLSTYSNKNITSNDIYSITGSISKLELIELVNNYLNVDNLSLLEFTENAYINGKNFYRIAEDMLYLFQNILVCKKANEYFLNKNLNYKEQIILIAEKISNVEIIQIIIERLEKLLIEISNSNYPRVLFEIFLLTTPIDKIVSTNSISASEVKSNVEKVTNKSNKCDIMKEKSNVISDFPVNKIDESIKEILINNTVYGATTECKNNVKKMLDELSTYLVPDGLKNAVTILQDASVRAASLDHVLLTYKYESMVLENDAEINNIEKIFYDKMGNMFQIVAITEDAWNKKRPNYLKLKKSDMKYLNEKWNETNTTDSTVENKENGFENDFSKLIESEE